MSPPLPIDSRLVDHPKVRFMHQRRRTQPLPIRLAIEKPLRHLMEIAVKMLEHRIDGFSIPLLGAKK
jgi:hypothetical protein